MHVLGETLNQIFNISREVTTVENLSLELSKLALIGELSGEKKPECGLREGLRTAGGLRRLSSNSIKILSSIGNTVEMMKLRSFVKKSWHASHTSNNLANSNITEFSITVLFLEVVQYFLFVVDDMFHLLFKRDRELSLSDLHKDLF